MSAILRRCWLALVCLSCIYAGAASAQSYPAAKPVQIIVPFPTGGAKEEPKTPSVGATDGHGFGTYGFNGFRNCAGQVDGLEDERMSRLGTVHRGRYHQVALAPVPHPAVGALRSGTLGSFGAAARSEATS